MVGLSIGWRLAAAGCAVTCFDRAEPGQGATRAAAGMLAAAVETEPGEQHLLLPLALESQRLWPGFAAELEAATGQAVDLRTEGTLVVASTRDDVEALRTTFAFQKGLGLDLHWLTGTAAREKEPALNPRTSAAMFSPNDHQVDNRKLGGALAAAFRKAGGTLCPDTPVDRIEVAGGAVAGVVAGTDGREVLHRADIVVLAAGAWSRQIAGLPAESLPPVRPVKGQMLSLAMDPADPLLRHVVWAPKCYLVPRRDGTLIVGATVEEKGWDDRLTAGGMLALLDAAWRALPGVEELPLVESWVGFRPGSRDDAPILGPVPGVDGLTVATGHHRNGILLAPVTADAVAATILTGRTDPRIAGFGLDRFTPMDRPARERVPA